MVRVGIVGCGAISSTHAKALARIPAAGLSGFYDVLPERAGEAAKTFGGEAFESLEALCAASDAVSVCVPSGLHAEIGMAAAKSGCHVLVEKPIETTFAKASQLVETCRLESRKLSVVSQHRFAPDLQRLKQAIDDGTLGPILEGDAYIKWYRTQAYYDSGAWRGTWELDGGGCLINQGVHYIDMIQWLMGGVRAVQARVRTVAHTIEVEDVACALIEYRSGAFGVIQGSTSFFPGFSERLEVHGKSGSVVLEGDRVTAWEINEAEDDGSPYGRGVVMQPTPNLKMATPVAEELTDEERNDRWIEQHRLQVEDFVNAIEEDRDPFITGEMALEPLKVILAIYESSRREGARVEVDEP